MELSCTILNAYKERCSNAHKKEAMQQTYNAYAAGFRDALKIFKLLEGE